MPNKKQEDAPEKTLESKYIFKGHSINLRIDTIVTADGRRTTREIVEHRGVIVVVPLDADGNVLLVRQYRTPVEKRLLELPAGGIDEGEDAETAVIREMQEETGFKPQKLVALGGFYSAPGFCTEYLHLYLAMDLVSSRLTAEDTAEIELVRIPLTQALELVTSGKIQDAKTIAGLLLYIEWRKKNSE